MNGDGFDDLIVAAPGDDNNGSNSGSARVFSGVDGSVLHTFLGDAAGDFFGRSVSGAGDVNGDGFADLIVGAHRDDDNGTDSGSARVFSGLDGSVLHTFLGDAAGDNFGVSVSGAGDVNGDGFDDLIVGAYRDDDNGTYSGSARVFSGVDGSVLHTFRGDTTEDRFGRSVSAAGDVNGDGFADLIVGADGDDDNGSYSGSARVFSGVDGSVLHTFLGDAAGNRFGTSVSGAGDVNGDGFADLIVGASGDDDNGSASGSARVFLSTPTGFQPMPGPVQPFETVGIGGRDDDVLSGLIVSIQGPRSAKGTDLIVAPSSLPAGVFTGGFNAATGQIIFVGHSSVERYEQLLRDLRVTPSAFGGGRSITVEVIDAGGRLGNQPSMNGFGSGLIAANSFDFGDAPDTFGTTVGNDGARHQYSNLFLGSGVDIDVVPTLNANATGDDISGGFGNDDDGVTFVSAIARGQGGTLQVVSSGAGTLAGWIDFDQSGTFDPSERFEKKVVAGTNNVTFVVPGAATLGNTFARLRLSSDPAAVLLPTGVARDGEVEDYAVEVLQTQREFGDAPDSYGKGTGTGAFHNRGTNLHWLGASRDLESDDNNNADATGDDVDQTDDEDGVTFLTPLARNQSTTMRIVASQPGELSYWIDFDNSGTFDNATEKFTKTLSAGNNLAVFVTPGTAVIGDTFMRFRFASSAVANPTGVAPNGEVEDYQVTILNTQREFGDAPDSYRTSVAQNGPRHNLGPNTHWLGANVDREPDAYLSPLADGDDANDLDDDDGVTFTSLLGQGQSATIDVVASAPGELAYWIDFDRSGTFENATERFTATLTAGTNSLTFVVSNSAAIGSTYARFRFATNGAQIANAFGVASNGEVEDYRVDIVASQYDFGDAPDSYGTLFDSNGAYHTKATGNVFLGTARDLESDGVPSGFADGDDNSAAVNDEDGITFTSAITAGQQATFTAVASVAGELSWWVDFDGNGVFDNPSERFQQSLSAGANNLMFTVPGGAAVGNTYARFRFDTTVVNDPTGRVNDGEVEDYRVTINSSGSLRAADALFSDEDEVSDLLASLI